MSNTMFADAEYHQPCDENDKCNDNESVFIAMDMYE